MVIRARPKYLTKKMLNAANNDLIDYADEMYYNSGRAALKHFLVEWKKFNKFQKPTIVMQAFNCRVVADAALQAEYNILLLDANELDFSITAKQLKNLSQKPNVLLLTHYQGVPCIDYREIAEHCSSNNILLIDDLAQTEGSKINNIEVGTLSNVWIKSYAFDKPFFTWEGGALKINSNNDNEFADHFKDCHGKLEVESESKCKNDLTKLRRFMALSDRDKYFRGIQTDGIVEWLLESGKTGKLSAEVYSKAIKTVSKIYNKVSGYHNQITIQRMHDAKIQLALTQRKNFVPEYNESEALEEFIKHEGGKIISIPDSLINWNRYTVIDNAGKLRDKFNRSKIEISNFNWPVPLHKIFVGNENIIVAENLNVSEYLSANILNIPIWSNYFQNMK